MGMGETCCLISNSLTHNVDEIKTQQNIKNNKAVNTTTSEYEHRVIKEY